MLFTATTNIGKFEFVAILKTAHVHLGWFVYKYTVGQQSVLISRPKVELVAATQKMFIMSLKLKMMVPVISRELGLIFAPADIVLKLFSDAIITIRPKFSKMFSAHRSQNVNVIVDT